VVAGAGDGASVTTALEGVHHVESTCEPTSATRRTRFWSLVVLVPASILVAGLQVAAQTARIAGTVVDQAGHVVQNP